METFAVITTWNEFMIFSHFSMDSALFLKHLNDQLYPTFSILESFLIPCIELSPWFSTLAWVGVMRSLRGWFRNRWRRTPKPVFPFFTPGPSPGLLLFRLFQETKWKELTRHPQPDTVIIFFPLNKRSFWGKIKWDDSSSTKS